MRLLRRLRSRRLPGSNQRVLLLRCLPRSLHARRSRRSRQRRRAAPRACAPLKLAAQPAPQPPPPTLPALRPQLTPRRRLPRPTTTPWTLRPLRATLSRPPPAYPVRFTPRSGRYTHAQLEPLSAESPCSFAAFYRATGALREVLASCAWSAPSDALALLLHAAMLESGFLAATGAACCAPGAPPAGWRAAPGSFAFRYTFALPGGSGAPPPEAWLRCRAVGGALVAYGGLDDAPAVHRLELPLASGEPAALASPRTSWAAAKDALASRLLAAACEAAGAPPPAALTALPDALKRLLLAALPAEALAAVAATCRDLRYAAADDDLWRRLYERQFGQPDAPGAAAGAAALAARRGWRAAFAAAATERARQTRRDAMAADMRRRRPRPHVFPAVPGPPPGVPGAFPGIIGGDYDLHPGGGLGRGGFGGGGFSGGGGFGFGLMPPPGGPMGRGAMGGLPRPHHFSDGEEDGFA